MTNTKNTPTRSKRVGSKLPACRDTNPLRQYEATLLWTQHSEAKIIIEAASPAEAEEKADELSPEDIENWDSFDGELYADSVEPFTGGADDE